MTGPGFVHRLVQEGLDPAALQIAPGATGNAALMAGAHGEQVFDGHGGEVRADLWRAQFREKAHDFGVELQASIVDQQADGGGRPALGRRVLHVHAARRIRLPERLCHHRSLAIEHETVQLDPGVTHRLEKFDDPARVDAPFLRQGSGQRYIGHHNAS